MAEKCITYLTDFFDGYIEQFADQNLVATAAAGSSDDIFTSSCLELVVEDEFTSLESHAEQVCRHDQDHDHDPLVSHKSTINNISSWCCASDNSQQVLEEKLETTDSPSCRKRQRVEDGQQVISHITVERNRRKQMNHHLTVLRSLMPCFYVKRGDQASIIGGVVDYITELQQVLQSLEAKKQRKVVMYSEVLSPRPRQRPSPRQPPAPLSPLPVSPRTPQPLSPAPAYRPSCLQQPLLASSYLQQLAPPSMTPLDHPSVPNPSNSKPSVADVEVKFSGSNLLLKTISPRLPGQATKIVSLLEDLSLEIIQAGIHTVDETMVSSFTIKIGIECQLSAEDLVQHIQHTFY